MSGPGPARSILGGAAVVVLSGAAAYLGASLARREPATVGAPSASSGGGAAIEALERRVGYLEKRVDLIDETARTALEMARANQERGHGVPSPGVATAPAEPAPDGPAPRKADAVEPPAAEPDRNDGADGQMAELRRIHHATSRGAVVHTMTLFADASRDGQANRLAQSIAEARGIVNRYALKGAEVEEEIRRILADQWEGGARDIGPIVRDGLEKADVATVRERLRGLQAETDRRLRPLFDDEKWREYEEAAGGMRKGAEAILDEFEKARLSGK